MRTQNEEDMTLEMNELATELDNALRLSSERAMTIDLMQQKLDDAKAALEAEKIRSARREQLQKERAEMEKQDDVEHLQVELSHARRVGDDVRQRLNDARREIEETQRKNERAFVELRAEFAKQRDAAKERASAQQRRFECLGERFVSFIQHMADLCTRPSGKHDKMKLDAVLVFEAQRSASDAQAKMRAMRKQMKKKRRHTSSSDVIDVTVHSSRRVRSAHIERETKEEVHSKPNQIDASAEVLKARVETLQTRLEEARDAASELEQRTREQEHAMTAEANVLEAEHAKEIARLQKMLQDRSNEVLQTRKDLAQVKKILGQTQHKASQALQEQCEANERLERLQRRCKDLSAAATRHQDRISQLQEQVSRHSKRNTETEESTAQHNNLQQQVIMLREQVKRRDDRLKKQEAHVRALESSRDAYDEAEHRAESLASQLARKTTRLRHVEEALERERRRQLEAEIGENEALKTAKHDAQKYRRKLRDLQLHFDKTRRELDEAREKQVKQRETRDKKTDEALRRIVHGAASALRRAVSHNRALRRMLFDREQQLDDLSSDEKSVVEWIDAELKRSGSDSDRLVSHIAQRERAWRNLQRTAHRVLSQRVRLEVQLSESCNSQSNGISKHSTPRHLQSHRSQSRHSPSHDSLSRSLSRQLNGKQEHEGSVETPMCSVGSHVAQFRSRSSTRSDHR
ncbi:MAG: hypothetical protein MHM6MM_005855 [Cercozoa sp. M6MM]